MSSTPPAIAALYASMLTDDDVADLSDAEFRLWVMGMVKAANDRSRGVVKVGKPALVQRWACLSGGKDAAAQAVAGLLEKGRFVRDDDGTVRVRNWDRYQAPVTGLLETDPTDVFVPATEADAAIDGFPTVKQMTAMIASVIDETLPTVTDPLLAYAAAFTEADALLAGFREIDALTFYARTSKAGATESADDVERRLRAELRFACVKHAICSTFGDRFDRTAWGRTRQKIAALGRNGNQWVIAATLTSAGQNITGDVASYILGTATRLFNESVRANQHRAPQRRQLGS